MTNDDQAAAAPRPPYFAVSLLKFSLMSLCTFGLYEIWWFYVHWCRVKEREQSNIMPAWRAVFAAFWAYACMARIRTTAKERDIPAFLPAGPLTIAWILTLIVSRAPDMIGLLSLFSFVWLIPAQVAANRINLAVAPEHDRNARFSGWNIAALVVGGLTLLLAVIGAGLKT